MTELLRPVVFDDKYMQFFDQFKNATRNIPCPGFFNQYIPDQFVLTQPRFTQILCLQEQQYELKIFDFQLQTMSDCTFNGSFNLDEPFQNLADLSNFQRQQEAMQISFKR